MPHAFDGLRILDFSQIIAGPACTNFFAMHGADVVKIEHPAAGDQFRTIIKTDAYDTYGMSPSFMALNTGKKSLTIDLKHPKAKEIIFKLVETSDVLVENFRAGVIDKLGFGYEAVRAVKPDIVFCSISGYGQKGPKAGAPAYDGAVQAASGMMTVTGHRETGPTRTGYTVVDLSTALMAAFAVSTAVHRKSQTGLGQYLDVAMMDTSIWMMGPLMVSQMIGGEEFGLNGNDSPALTPTANVFPTSDGFIQITGMTEQHAASILEALGLSDSDDPRLASTQAMRDHHDDVRDLFADRMRLKPLAHWLKTFEDLKVPHAPIRDFPTVLADPQLDHRGILMDAPVPAGAAAQAGDSVKLVGPAYIANEDGPATMGPPPVLGEHTDTVLAEAGYTAADIAALRDDGVFG
jgi:crotonobetainyl-CoA:carnitine CoA-transferase CaiB-like acyl-CoA transferase